MIIPVFLWLTPVLIIPLSLAAYHFLPLSRFRNFLYSAFLFGAFLINLTGFSFHNGFIASGVFFLVNFIILEWFWVILRFKNRQTMVIACIIGIAAYLGFHSSWLLTAPGTGIKLWNPPVVSTYIKNDKNYCLKEEIRGLGKKKIRKFILASHVNGTPLEKEIRTYITPDGYDKTPFTYKWNPASLGVRLDLVTDGYVLWTMGEGY